MSVADVDGLPWWEWRMLVEGLDAESRANAGEEPQVTPAGPAEAQRMEADLFARAGMTVHHITQ